MSFVADNDGHCVVGCFRCDVVVPDVVPGAVPDVDRENYAVVHDGFVADGVAANREFRCRIV